MYNLLQGLTFLLAIFLFINGAVYFILKIKTRSKGTKEISHFWFRSFALYFIELALPAKSWAFVSVLTLKTLPLYFIVPLFLKRSSIIRNPLRLSGVFLLCALSSFLLIWAHAPVFLLALPAFLFSLTPLLMVLWQLRLKKSAVLGRFVFLSMILLVITLYLSVDDPSMAGSVPGLIAEGSVYFLISALLTVRFMQLKNHEELSHLRAELLSKDRELNESNLEKERMLRVLVHDISNPLQAAMFQSGQLRKMGLRDEREGLLLEKLQKSLVSIKDIIAHVREYQHVVTTSRKVDYALDEVNLSECLSEVDELFQDRFLEKKVQLLYHNKLPADTTVRVNKTAFVHSVAANLLSNALKFSCPGSEVLVMVGEKDGHVSIEISDKGIGMSKENLRQLFEVGSPVSRSGTLGERGMGFGMPVVKAYMGLFNGRIEAQSVQGEMDSGTTIHLYLPKNSPSFNGHSTFLQ